MEEIKKGDSLEDTSWSNVSLNLKYYFPTLPRWIFVNAAPGIYMQENNSPDFGWFRGGGVYWPINSTISAEAAYNYHTIFTKPNDTTFSTIWLGIKYRF